MRVKNNRGESQKMNSNHIVKASGKGKLSILDANSQIHFNVFFEPVAPHSVFCNFLHCLTCV